MQITRRDDHANVLAGIEAALAAGFSKLKLNVVVMSGINDDDGTTVWPRAAKKSRKDWRISEEVIERR